PAATSIVDEPVVWSSSPISFPRSQFPSPASRNVNIFSMLPDELINEIFFYLTSSDIFSLRQACPEASRIVIPTLMYKRFVVTEFDFYPPLTTVVREYLRRESEARRNREILEKFIDWQATFER